MLIRFLFILILITSLPINAFAVYSLPQSRDIVFDPGIPGGIPSRPAAGGKTIYVNSYGATANDSNSDSSALSAALNAASAGDVVQFGAGKYILTSTFGVPNGVTVRGQGMDVTTLEYTGSGGTVISAGNMGSCNWNDQWCVQVPLAANGKKGDTVLQLNTGDANLNSFNPGDIIVVSMSNAGLEWVDMGNCTWNTLNNDIDGGDSSYMQTVEVIARSGGSLTIDPPLYEDMPTSQRSYVGKDSGGGFGSYVGLEDFTLTRTRQPSGQTSMIQYTRLKYSWVKGVEIDHGHGRMINFVQSYRCVMEGNYVHHGKVYTSGALNYHLVLGPATARTLVTNNITMYTNCSLLLETTGGGNVVSYNYMDGSWVNESDPDWQSQDVSNHCAHSHHELFEGNWMNRFNMDAIHGSASHFIVFRNYIDSDHEFTIAQPDHPYQDTRHVAAVAADLGYYLSVVGNILGKEGRTNIYECNPGSNCNTNAGNNHVYMFRTSDNSGISPYSTILRHANFDYYNDKVLYNGNDDQALPNSLYLQSAPSWWNEQGTRPWPPIDPKNPNSVVDIPAKDRFENQHANFELLPPYLYIDD